MVLGRVFFNVRKSRAKKFILKPVVGRTSDVFYHFDAMAKLEKVSDCGAVEFW